MNDFLQSRGSSPNSHSVELSSLLSARALAEQAFSRAAGSPLIADNSVRLLVDAAQNYPAWLAAIAAARDHVHFESYIIYEDSAGLEFADALIAKAQEGVRVRLVYDWMGALGKTSRKFWNRLRAGGVEVRCYNPPRFDSPLGWLSRDHRKMIAIDGEVAFISGLCIGRMWVGDREKRIEPWRDTGVEVRGPAVIDVERSFADTWAMMGAPIPEDEMDSTRTATSPAGNVNLRIVATVPATAGLFRLDQLVSAIARKRLWLTDAYFAGTASYVQALRAAAQDGIDVRLLVPNATDIPLLRPLSRSGFRPLIEAGIRIFEWNGTMIHAKTAVADRRWARVGSTNLNVASWLGNCELDVVIEDHAFAHEMEEMYLRDLANSTELVLDDKRRVCAPGEPRHPRPASGSGSGSAGRATAGAVRLGKTIGAAFANRRMLETVEASITAWSGVILLGLAVVFGYFPRALAYPFAVFAIWIGLALLSRAYKLRRAKRMQDSSTR